MNIYVGNLAPHTTVGQLRQVFARYGEVGKIGLDGHPGGLVSHRFCFVEMPFNNQAFVATKKTNGLLLDSCALVVRESGVAV